MPLLVSHLPLRWRISQIVGLDFQVYECSMGYFWLQHGLWNDLFEGTYIVLYILSSLIHFGTHTIKNKIRNISLYYINDSVLLLYRNEQGTLSNKSIGYLPFFFCFYMSFIFTLWFSFIFVFNEWPVTFCKKKLIIKFLLLLSKISVGHIYWIKMWLQWLGDHFILQYYCYRHTRYTYFIYVCNKPYRKYKYVCLYENISLCQAH